MQRPGREVSSSLRNRRTQPTLPGPTSPTAPVVAQSPSAGLYEPRAQSKKRYTPRHALFQLLLLGTLLEVCWLALYPLLAAATPPQDVAKQALLGLFPWLPQLFWTTRLPFLNSWLAVIPFFQPTRDEGNTNLLFLLLALSFALTLLAAITGKHVMKVKPSVRDISTLFSTILLFTILFGITFVFAAPVLSQDMFLYGTYARLVTVYHINPYTTLLSTFPHDLLHTGLPKDMQGRAVPGPIWIDLSLPVVLLARESIANVLLGFRLLGLLAHLANVALLWLILARLKPTARIFATLLYAWNPLMLLLSVSDMHLDVVLLLVLFLAILFFQRKSSLLSWVFLLVAVLINPLSSLLLPCFLRLLSRGNSTGGRRVWWWLSMGGLSICIPVLAYTPYWQSWGLNGLLTSMRQAFLPDAAINSLDMALLKLPIKFSPALLWLLTPQHWILFAVITVVCILLLGLWLADTLELVVLFSSWLMLALLVLFPIYWPWYVFVPLGLALCSANNRTILLAMLLTVGALICWYFWLWQPVWSGLALITVGFPLLLWGWLLFFRATWVMTRPPEPEPTTNQQAHRGFSRPSRPPWSGNTRSRPSHP